MNTQTLQHYRSSDQDFVKEMLALKHHVLQNGRMTVTNFLSLHEQDILQSIMGQDVHYIFYGGFATSERKIAIISDYIVNDYEHHVVILRLTYNAKFGTLRHPDVLGAILSLGLERKVVGDILVQSAEIFVALRENIASYVQQQLCQIGRQAIRVEQYDGAISEKHTHFNAKSIYVQSLRLDSLVSHVVRCNRDKAKGLIMKELVQVNGVIVSNYKVDYHVHDVVSIRKYGRVYIDAIMKTKRERFKVEVRTT